MCRFIAFDVENPLVVIDHVGDDPRQPLVGLRENPILLRNGHILVDGTNHTCKAAGNETRHEDGAAAASMNASIPYLRD